MNYIENKTFDEIKIGDSASLSRTLKPEDIKLFAVMSGDVNPAHVDEEFARSDMFHKIVAHGMWGGALISTLLGTKLPGPGAIYLGQTLKFTKPVALGDTVTVKATVTSKDPEKHRVSVVCSCTNQYGEVVISGNAQVMAPLEKVKRPRAVLPEVRLFDPGARFRELIKGTKGLPPIRMGVVHPVDGNSLRGAIDAAENALITPVLIGPEAKIRSAAAAESIDLTPYEIVPTRHSREAAVTAVALARTGKLDALMKGNLHTDELMHEIVAQDIGLRTGRRMSHVFVVDKPGSSRLGFLTDAAINIYPDLETKRDIVQNAIDLAHVLGVESPKVAILSAVETVTSKLKSTLEAAALCKMADRGQITGGVLDGPLGADNAVSEDAAKIKGIKSLVAGRADIFVVPDLESGNMLAKLLEYLAESLVAGIVMGAQVPIVLTSRADKSLSRIVSCAIALLLARRSASNPILTESSGDSHDSRITEIPSGPYGRRLNCATRN
jgi:phosphate acetyltransferase/phosphate butyryltransferase